MYLALLKVQQLVCIIYIYIVSCCLHRSHNSIVVFPTVPGINVKDIYHFILGISVHDKLKHDDILCTLPVAHNHHQHNYVVHRNLAFLKVQQLIVIYIQ